MTNLKKMTGNELSELLSLYASMINLIERDFLHVQEYCQKDKAILIDSYQKLVNEENRREDLF